MISIDGPYAFRDCTNLTSVTFQGNGLVYKIHEQAFNGDLEIKYSAGGAGTYTTTAPVLDTAVWTKQQTFTSIADMEAWLSAQPDNTAASPHIIKLNVSVLDDYSSTAGSAGAALIANNTKYVSLDLSGSTFNSIIDMAFENCANLTSIILPSSLQYIDANFLFRGCTGLTSITFQSTIVVEGYIQDEAFLGDLKTKYIAGGAGTYTTTAPVSGSSVWTKR